MEQPSRALDGGLARGGLCRRSRCDPVTVMPTDPASTVPNPVAPGGWPARRYTTGLAELDRRLPGVTAGELWVVTGAPGQGRSMFLTQLARRMACDHGLPTWLSSNRDPAVMGSGRLHSAIARVPLGHLADDQLTSVDRDRLAAAADQLAATMLRIVDGRLAANRVIDELLTQPREGQVTAAFLDDPDWPAVWALRAARELADSGVVVVVTLPRERVLDGPAFRCDLHPEMTLADVVVEVRHTNLAAADVEPSLDQPGYAALAVLRNRRGPVGNAVVAFQAHYARFVDTTVPGR
jgi:replicative DNA helicase